MQQIKITLEDITRAGQLKNIKELVPFISSFYKNKDDFPENAQFNKVLSMMIYTESFKEEMKDYQFMWHICDNIWTMVLFRAPARYVHRATLSKIFNRAAKSGCKFRFSDLNRGYKCFGTVVKYLYRMSHPPKNSKLIRPGIFWLSNDIIDKVITQDKHKTDFGHITLTDFFKNYSKVSPTEYFIQPTCMGKLRPFSGFVLGEKNIEVDQKTDISDEDSDGPMIFDIFGDSSDEEDDPKN